MIKELRVSPDLALPLDAVTKTLAIVAMTGAGKSNAGVVLAEEFHAAGLPFVAIDPKGDWWGMRSSGDGTGPGLPIPIFGGLHGDLPLLPEMGKLIADLIADHNLTCILDVSEFASRAAQMRFLADFGEQLYRRHGKNPAPRHLILEEADEYLPQVVRADEARCVGVWTRIVKRGRQRGLGISILTQRCASVNKDGLSQCGTLIPMRTIGAHDRKAILDWISYHDSPRDIVDRLPGLLDGEACVISPQWLVSHGQPAVQQFRFRRRWTFDSGATPAFDQARPPATLADIDLGALQGRMEAVAEKAAQDDPKALRRRIADLERKLAAARREIKPAEPERIEVTVEVPVVTPAAVAALDQSITAMREAASQIEFELQRARRASTDTPAPVRPVPPVSTPARRIAPPETVPAPDGPLALGKAHRAILSVLAQFPDGRSIRQLAMLTGYSAKGGGFRNALGALRTAGMVGRGEPIRITEAGIAAIGDEWEPLPEGPALIEHWLSQLGKAEGLALRTLLAAWPAAMTAEQVAEATGYSATGGGFRNALGKLRTLQLIDGYGEMRADETLAQHAQGGIHA